MSVILVVTVRYLIQHSCKMGTWDTDGYSIQKLLLNQSIHTFTYKIIYLLYYNARRVILFFFLLVIYYNHKSMAPPLGPTQCRRLRSWRSNGRSHHFRPSRFWLSLPTEMLTGMPSHRKSHLQLRHFQLPSPEVLYSYYFDKLDLIKNKVLESGLAATSRSRCPTMQHYNTVTSRVLPMQHPTGWDYGICSRGPTIFLHNFYEPRKS